MCNFSLHWYQGRLCSVNADFPWCVTHFAMTLETVDLGCVAGCHGLYALHWRSSTACRSVTRPRMLPNTHTDVL